MYSLRECRRGLESSSLGFDFLVLFGVILWGVQILSYQILGLQQDDQGSPSPLTFLGEGAVLWQARICAILWGLVVREMIESLRVERGFLRVMFDLLLDSKFLFGFLWPGLFVIIPLVFFYFTEALSYSPIPFCGLLFVVGSCICFSFNESMVFPLKKHSCWYMGILEFLPKLWDVILEQVSSVVLEFQPATSY